MTLLYTHKTHRTSNILIGKSLCDGAFWICPQRVAVAKPMWYGGLTCKNSPRCPWIIIDVFWLRRYTNFVLWTITDLKLYKLNGISAQCLPKTIKLDKWLKSSWIFENAEVMACNWCFRKILGVLNMHFATFCHFLKFSGLPRPKSLAEAKGFYYLAFVFSCQSFG